MPLLRKYGIDYMNKIKFKDIEKVKKLYHKKGVYVITSEKYWDGGYDIDASLDEKMQFYSYAKKYSDVLKNIIYQFGDKAIIGKDIGEKSDLFAHWKDMKCYDSFNNLNEQFNKKSNYEINHNDEIIDYIIENNFRYFSFIDFYLPKYNIILQPTCHTEIFIYSDNYKEIISKIETIIGSESELNIKYLEFD